MLFNLKYIQKYLTNNQKEKTDANGQMYKEQIKVPYRWTHGATDLTLGDGLLVRYFCIYFKLNSI